MNSDELLPSWCDSDAKSAVLEFVESVSGPGASYVPPPRADRDLRQRRHAVVREAPVRPSRLCYDTGAEKALAEATERGWTVVSMRNDFKVVFDP